MSKYRLVVRGKNPDYFLRKLYDKKINLYEIKKEFKKLELVVDEDGYKKIKDIKTSYDVVVVSVSGVLKIIEIIRKYYIFIIFFCMGIFLNILLSMLIFDVEVIHANKYIRSIVYDSLEEFGISKFKFKVSFSEKEKIIKAILKKEKDNLEWLEIEEIGTKYVVRVEQRKLNKESETCAARNIVAKKNALLLEISADSGEVVKKKWDYVYKGDIIISGVIHNKDEVVSNKCAVGKVFGEVWYKIEVELPIKYNEVKLTGNNKYGIGITALNDEYSFNGFETFKSKALVLFGKQLFNFNLGLFKYYETDVLKRVYTLDNCEEQAIKIGEEKILLMLGSEDEILTKKVLKKTLKNSKIVVEVFFKVKENITSYQDVVER